MKALHFGRAAAVISVAALALTACGSDDATGDAAASEAASTPAASAGASSEAMESSSLSGELTGIGASSQNSAMEAWRAGFQSANPDVTVQYSPDGSGAGRTAFLAGGAQFAGSDAYLSEDEMTQAMEVCGPDGAIDIPAYISPIAIAFNLEGVENVNLDAATIAQIFKGEISTWNDPAIADQNEGVELPDTPITVVHRSDESGTTENFTEYLAAAASEDWTDEADGNWPSEYQSENAQGTSGVVQTVTATPGAITYADNSAIGSLGTVNVQVGDDYTEISSEAAALAVDVATPVEDRPENDLALELQRDTTESGAYPVVLISYHIYCTTYEDQETVDLVKAFGSYVISEDGQNEAESSAGSAPLSETLREQAQTAIDSIEVAS